MTFVTSDRNLGINEQVILIPTTTKKVYKIENKNNLDFAWEICILIGSLFPSKVGTNNKTKIKAIISTKINHIMTKLYP